MVDGTPNRIFLRVRSDATNVLPNGTARTPHS